MSGASFLFAASNKHSAPAIVSLATDPINTPSRIGFVLAEVFPASNFHRLTNTEYCEPRSTCRARLGLRRSRQKASGGRRRSLVQWANAPMRAGRHLGAQ